jgi:hypothetical protein
LLFPDAGSIITFALQRSLQKDQKTTRKIPQPSLQNMDTEKIVIGRLEKFLIIPPGQVFHARIDTGATTSSLDARDIQIFERDGSKWILFPAPGRPNMFNIRSVHKISGGSFLKIFL